jgi:acetylornithine/succinyldiaminopimelate/putrescine aminotransferase
VLGDEEMKYAYRPLLPDIRQIRFNVMEDIEQITEKTAGVLIEPIQAEAGILIPDPDYLPRLREKCCETGTLLIFDEIQMGFGRTGSLFAFEQFGVEPDILCLAKAMGGGMPIGAFISSKETMDTLTHHPALGHITTFGGHPVCCAAAMAGLEVILEEELHSKANEKGQLFVERLSHHPEVREIRQAGLMLGVELASPEKVSQLIRLFFEQGIIVDQFLFNSSSFRIAPPLIISTDQISEISGHIIQCLNKL